MRGPACSASGAGFRAPALLLIGVTLGLACSSSVGDRGSHERLRSRPASEFSGARALENVDRLTGSSNDPSVACEPTREVLLASLRRVGADPEALEVSGQTRAAPASEAPGPIHAVVGKLSGTSPDPILLIAPYLSACSSSRPNAAAQGSAGFLLELVRVLSGLPRPYSIWLIFVEEESDPGAADSAATDGVQTPWRESQAVAQRLEDQGVLRQVRVAVFFDGLGRPGAGALRDSHSHPAYREVFWESARDLGATDVFRPDAPFASSPVGHRAFIEQGLRRTVLVRTTDVASVGPSSVSGSRRDQAQALESVGSVTLDALARIQARLERIDGLSSSSGPE